MIRYAIVTGVALAIGSTASVAAPPPGGGGTKTPTVQGVAVVDSAGKVVGKSISPGLGSRSAVLFTIGTTVYGVNLDGFYTSNGFPDNSKLGYIWYQSLLFASSDCSGPAYVQTESPAGVAGAVTVPDATSQLWLYPVSGVLTLASVNSQFRPAQFGQGSTCIAFALGQQYVYPVTGSPTNITTMFTQPFTLQ